MATLLKQSTAVDIGLGPFVDSVDGVTAETALTISQADVRLKKNGGAWAQKSDTNSATHEENGWYEVALNTTDTDTLGILLVAVNETGALPVWREFQVVPANVYDSLVGGSATLSVDATQISGDATAANNLEAALDGTGGVTLSLGAMTVSGALTVSGGATFTNSSGSGLICSSSGGNGNGLALSGNGSGSGLNAFGGATGHGAILIGGVTSGDGLHCHGTTAGDGIHAESHGTNQHGLHASGIGTGSGIYAVGGATGNGMSLVGGATSGDGLDASVTSGIEIDANITGNITGNLSGSVGSLTTNNDKTGYALSAAGVTAVQSGLSTLTTAQVNAEVVDALATDTYAEPGSAPAATATLAAKIGWLFTLARNKVTMTSTTQTLRNDADSSNVATSTHSDDGTTYTRGEWS